MITQFFYNIMRSLILVFVVSFFMIPLTCKAGGPYSDLHATSTDRSVIATLFEWRFDDIANECEQFLGPVGYAAVQTSPILEYAVISKPSSEPEADRPWYERYQPVSYKIISRSGDEAAFSDMVDRCNKAGVRVIVDLVLNHMTSSMDGVGVGETQFKGQSDKSYPGVPYDQSNFNSKQKCGSSDGSIQDSGNPRQVRNCELFGLHDLDTSSDFVRSKQREAINRLLFLGAAGFRLDASKHIWPSDFKAIFDSVRDLNSSYFPSGSRPFLSHEVMPGGAVTMAEYTPIGRVFEFNYRSSIRDVFHGYNNQKLKWLKNFGEGWSFVKSADAVSIVDNPDLQRSEPYSGVNFRSPNLYQMATAFMLAWPYGIPNVMSSYDWPTSMEGDNDKNKHMGPPSDEQKKIKNVVIKDGKCVGPWVCEHRWKPIANMVRFRQIVADEPVTNWWDNGNNSIAFCRGSKGCVMINNEPGVVTATLKTGLPEGNYCDVISGDIQEGGQCSGETISVNSNGDATITIDGSKDAIPMVAWLVSSSASKNTNPPVVDQEQDKPSKKPDSQPASLSLEDKKTLDYCALCHQSLARRKVEL